MSIEGSTHQLNAHTFSAKNCARTQNCLLRSIAMPDFTVDSARLDSQNAWMIPAT